MKTTVYLAAVLFLAQQANLEATIIVNNVEFPDDIRFYRASGEYVEIQHYYQTGYYRDNGGPMYWREHVHGTRSTSWSVKRSDGIALTRGDGEGTISHISWYGESPLVITGIVPTPLDQYFLSVSTTYQLPTESWFGAPTTSVTVDYYEPNPAAVLASLKAATSLTLSVSEHEINLRYLIGDFPITCNDVCVPEPSSITGWIVLAMLVRRLVQ